MNVIEANVIVHTAMAYRYNEEPHFSPDNRRQVRSRLEQWKGAKMLDIGCGTGFIIDLAYDLFTEVHGLDATTAMLDKVVPRDNLLLHHGAAEDLPFADGIFDLVTAYSFIHHLDDYAPVLKEARRVLKDGGRFYVDLDPNADYWRLMRSLDGKEGLPAIVAREVDAVCRRDAEVAAQFGIDQGIFDKAENLKAMGGIDAGAFRQAAHDAGFRKSSVERHWFLGQGRVTSAFGMDTQHISAWMHQIGQLSSPLFKYLRFELIA